MTYSKNKALISVISKGLDDTFHCRLQNLILKLQRTLNTVGLISGETAEKRENSSFDLSSNPCLEQTIERLEISFVIFLFDGDIYFSGRDNFVAPFHKLQMARILLALRKA